MDENEKRHWLLGFLEAEVSFGIYLNLIGRKHSQYLVLKPYVMIQAKDADVMKYLHESFGFETSITDKKNKDKDGNVKLLNALRVQKFTDIDRITKVLNNHTFISHSRQRVYNNFLKAYEHIKRIGHTWKAWDDEIATFIDECLPIKDNDKGYTNAEWKQRIRTHFGEYLDTGNV